jgi:hypothetical protein
MLDFDLVGEQQLIDRAIRAYWRACKKKGIRFWMPANTSEVEEFMAHGRMTKCVVLRNCRGLVCVYRLKKNGLLSLDGTCYLEQA